MKPNHHFKLAKQSKRIMASIVNKDARDTYRQIAIQAQLCSEMKPEPKKEKTNAHNGSNTN
jgi:hypothetical protein